MDMHLHFGLIQGLSVFAYVVVIGFFWRLLAAHNHNNALGQAMSVIY